MGTKKWGRYNIARRWLFILPAVFISNLFAFMDRMVISMALGHGGMMDELALSATVVGIASGALSVGMIFLPPLGSRMAHEHKTRPFIAITIFIWSALSAATGLVQGEVEFIILRFLLGFVEGSLTAAVMTFLPRWFPDKNGERSLAISAYFSAYPLSGVVMGPLTGAILSVYDWRVMFFILGGISACTGLLWLLLIRERPEDAKYLSEEEKTYIVETIKAERAAFKEKHPEHAGRPHGKERASGKKKREVIFATLARDKRVWLLLFAMFAMSFAQSGWGLWMPSMIKNITGAGIMMVGVLSILPNLVQLFGLWLAGFLIKRVKDRRLMASVPLALLGLVFVTGTITTHIGSGAVFGFTGLILAGLLMHGPTPAFQSLPSILFDIRREGATRGLIGSVNALGSFAGSFIISFFVDLFGTTDAGMVTAGVLLMIGAICIMFLPRPETGNEIAEHNAVH